MPIDSTDLTALKALAKPKACAYLMVQWDPSDSAQTRYYSDACYDQLSGYQRIGVRIEARLLQNIIRDIEFDLNPDFKTEVVPFSFTDIPDENGDREISGRFDTYKSGVRCEIFFYYPDINTTVSKWFGQLQKPPITGHKRVDTVATNGFINREVMLPNRLKGRECPSQFGKMYPRQFSHDTAGCGWDLHLVGGSVGNAGFDDCPRRDVGDCTDRITPSPSNAPYFQGWNIDASPTITNNQGFVAVSKGNASTLKQPVRVIVGEKYLRIEQPTLWRRRLGASNPEHNWVDQIWEIGEGPMTRVYSIKVIEKFIEANYQVVTSGNRAQLPLPYASNMSNFSRTVMVMTQYGWVNALSIGERDLRMECRAVGINNNAVFTDATTYVRQWVNDRVWFLFECYTNQTWGLKDSDERFEILDWIARSQTSRDEVEFTAYYPDGESEVHSGRRTTMDASLEGRPAFEQIDDICGSGAISIPFQHEGKYTLSAFVPATVDELNDAPIFTDVGPTKNIVWDAGQPAISVHEVPDDQIYNEIVMTYEEASNKDIERPLTIDDPNQKLLAGRAKGVDYLFPVPTRMSAFGIRNKQEVVRLGNRILRFGKYDEGGTQNNLRVRFYVPMIHAENLKRYQFIKVVSTLVNDREVGTVIAGEDYRENAQWFRLLKPRKVSGGRVEIVAQVYNRTAYEAFETVTLAGSGAPPSAPVGPPPPPPPTCVLTFSTTPVYDDINGVIPVPIDPC